MKIGLKKLLSKTAIILVIALTCSFFAACKVESVAEHDKRVAKEAEELEKQVKDITKNNTIIDKLIIITGITCVLITVAK